MTKPTVMVGVSAAIRTIEEDIQYAVALRREGADHR